MTKEEVGKTIEDYVRTSLRGLDLNPIRNERYEAGARHIIDECKQEADRLFVLCAENNWEAPFDNEQQVEFFVRQTVAELAFTGRLSPDSRQKDT